MKMKKVFLAVVILAIGFVIYFAPRIKGALPTFLPPKEPAATTSTATANNDLSLIIPAGFSIEIVAKGLGSPRDLLFDEKGNLLISVTASGKIVAIGGKEAETHAGKTVEVLTGLRRPHGLAFYAGKLYVAAESQVARYTWNPQTLTASLDKVLFQLPAGGRHFTRSIAFKADGTMFVSIGSTCDVCHEKDPFLASVIVSDKDGSAPRLFARGLRNSTFITIEKNSQKLWGTEMGRDNLGDNLPPDEINIIKKNNHLPEL